VSAPGVWRAPSAGPGARERLLREIVARVPVERIAEVHLFPPMRQGGVETGVAVIAAEREELAESFSAAWSEGSASVADATSPNAGDAPDAGDSADAIAACDPTDLAAGPPPESNDTADASKLRHPNDASSDDSAAEDPAGDAPAVGDPPVGDPAVGDPAAEDPAPAPAAPRFTVLTARYRLTLKGPDRGRWEADVTVEADAPLLTVDAVVRGVQRRAGDGGAPERLDARALAAVLGPPAFDAPPLDASTPR